MTPPQSFILGDYNGQDRTGARCWMTGGAGRVLHAAPSAASDGRARRGQAHGHACTRARRWMTGGAGRVQLWTAELAEDRHTEIYCYFGPPNFVGVMSFERIGNHKMDTLFGHGANHPPWNPTSGRRTNLAESPAHNGSPGELVAVHSPHNP
ncbi:uncharacterized protein LOC144110951 [Amblyomma americanum]